MDDSPDGPGRAPARDLPTSWDDNPSATVVPSSMGEGERLASVPLAAPGCARSPDAGNVHVAHLIDVG